VATQPNQFVCGRFSDEPNPKLAVKWMFIAPQGEGMGFGVWEGDPGGQGRWQRGSGRGVNQFTRQTHAHQRRYQTPISSGLSGGGCSAQRD